MRAHANEMLVRKKQIIEEAVTQLMIDWLPGEIHLVPGSTDGIEIVQWCPVLFPERRLFRVQHHGNSVKIKDGRKSWPGIAWNWRKTVLKIILPKHRLESLAITGVGMSVKINQLHADTCICNVTSGRAELSGKLQRLQLKAVASLVIAEGLEAEELALRATSSNIELSGGYSEVDAHVTGGKLALLSAIVPHCMDTLSTAAKLTFSIPDNDGFTLRSSKYSGSCSSNFSMSNRGSDMVYKDGSRIYSAKLRGGSYHLLRS